MDEEAIFRIAEIAAWLMSGIASIIIILLSVIAYFIKKGHDHVEVRLTDHDNKFDKVHEEIKESNAAIHQIALDIAENMKRRK